MEKLAKEDPIVEMNGIVCNSERKTRRRLIQSTLFQCESRADEEDRDFSAEEEDDEDEYRESESKGKKRKRKTQPKTPTKTPKKSPTKSKKAVEAKNKTSPVTAKQDFFLKVSERRLQQKQQREQQGTVDLTVEDSKCCKALEPVAGKKNCQPLKKRDVSSTPRKYTSCSEAKRSHSQRTITDSNFSAAKDLSTQNENMPQAVVDLRLEAKLAAEEYAQLSAGRQLHPFFSSWKTTKSYDSLEIYEVGSKMCSVLQNDGILSCSPIHVIDTLQDDRFSLDWNGWTFCEGSLLNSGGYCGLETTCSSVFEDSVKPLKVDSFVTNSNCYHIHTSSLQNELYKGQPPDGRKTIFAMSKTASSTLADGQEALQPLLEYLKMIQQNDKIGLLSVCAGCVGNLEDEQQHRFLHERIISYHLRHHNQPNCCLWTNKYQPEVASEVCGNVESVKSLSDWLQCWRERVPQSSRSYANSDKCNIQDSGSWCQNESDTESMDEEGILKNVFLITGPVGSGKSAAIYACAKEKGFHVIEVNASDWRNGVHVKQKFGEAVESHGFNRWSSEELVDLSRKHSVGLCSTQRDSTASEEHDCEVIEVTSTTCKQEFWNAMAPSRNDIEKKTACSQRENKTLVLFEDVDIIFDEDRGFIATLLQLAETAKRPMILTSNSKDPVLPKLLDRLVTDFSVPSLEELLSEVYMACAAEEANISPLLIERFIRCCEGDIRKTLMHVQFWCQGKRVQDRKIECTYSPLQFDLVAAHQVIPKLIPWGFPCQLSVLVEKEISNSMMMENAMFLEAVEEEPNFMGMGDALELGNNETDSIKAMKEAMLRRNPSAHDGTEFVSQFHDVGDFSNVSGSPVTFVQQNVRQKLRTAFSYDSEDDKCCKENLAGRTVRRKLSTVLSSDSEDDKCCMDNLAGQIVRRKLSTVPSSDSEDDNFRTENLPAMLHILTQDPNNKILRDVSGRYLEQKTMAPGYLEESMCQGPFKNSETASDLHICDTYKSVDVSCVPESSFVPETELNDGMEFLPTTVSCNHFDVTLEDISSMSGVKNLSMMDVNALDKPVAEANKLSETVLAYTCEIDANSIHGNEEVGDCQNVNAEFVTGGYSVMDACSRADFSAGLISMENPRQPIASESVQNFGCPVLSDSVQETWRKLRSRREDLKSHITSEKKVASQIMILASGLTNLISDADMMLSSCQPLINDILEPSMVPCIEPDYVCWYDEQLEMASTFAQHGFCLFAEKSAAVGSTLGHENQVDLAQEMLACSTSTMAQGKLVIQEMSRIQNSRNLKIEAPCINISLRREVEPRLYSTVFSLVPARSCLALKGGALHEYLSFLSQISRSEASRLQETNGRTKQCRRVRGARHYLCTGTLTLSPEEVLLLAKHGLYGEECQNQIVYRT